MHGYGYYWGHYAYLYSVGHPDARFNIAFCLLHMAINKLLKRLQIKSQFGFNWNIVCFKEMDDSPRNTKEGGDCGVFVCLGMHYVLLNHLFKTDIDRSTDVPQESLQSYMDLVMLWTLKMTRFANIETSAHTNQNQTLPAKDQLPLTTA